MSLWNFKYDVAAKTVKTEFLQDIIKWINLLKEVFADNSSTLTRTSK